MKLNDAMVHLGSVSSVTASMIKMPLMFLPAHQRKGLLTLYAFGKAIDDIADGQSDIQQKQRAFNVWREILRTREFSETGQEQDDLIRQLFTVIDEFHLDINDLLMFIDSQEVTANADPFAFLDQGHMLTYFDSSAGSLARLILPVIDAQDESALAFLVPLAKAAKAVNILRDFVEDGQNGVIYAPRSLISAPPELSRKWLMSEATYESRLLLKNYGQGMLEQADRHWLRAYRVKLMPAYMLMKTYENMMPEVSID